MQKSTSATQQRRALAGKAGEFPIGNELQVVRLGFGAMRITGKGIWGEPPDRAEAIRVLRARSTWESISSIPQTLTDPT
jgi:hypothetical protein